ncbi:phage gp6-like head-tail connector protein [Peribacillus frigoritolerans]|uniref:phage gp6-like head-tail connector protein n=1 Tax=Peribacillus frigoritolerans TaxID=450367 RepID=UPI0032E49AA3
MHISHSIEDDNLKRLLSFSIVDLLDKCGEFDIEENERAKELVFERTRYAYNDALEYFNDNFLSQINSLGLSIALKEGEPDAAV